MTDTTDTFDAIWDDAFDREDDLTQLNIHRIARIRRDAMARKSAVGTGKGRRQPQAETQAPMGTASYADRTRWVPDLTKHCAQRLQQRGIAIQDVVTVLDYGRKQRSHGADRIFFDRQSRQRLQTERPDLIPRLERLDLQIVAGDDNRIVTVAHRTKRNRRDLQRRWGRGRVH